MMLARPKGSIFPYHPIAKEEDGMYALKFILGSGWIHTVWYSHEELDIKMTEDDCIV